MDVMYVLDASGSVGSRDFGRLLDFVATLTSKLNVSASGTHVGVVRYSTRAQLLIRLGSITDPTKLDAEIRKIGFPGGSTATGNAITLAHQQGFQNSRQSQGVPSVMIVLTDGKTTRGPQPAGPAAAAKADGIRILGIGIGSGIRRSDLEKFASSPDSVYLIEGFTPEAFNKVLEPLRSATCKSEFINSNAFYQSSTITFSPTLKFIFLPNNIVKVRTGLIACFSVGHITNILAMHVEASNRADKHLTVLP